MTGKRNDREAELEAAFEATRKEAWKPWQTLPWLHHEIALILQQSEARRELKNGNSWPCAASYWLLCLCARDAVITNIDFSRMK